MNFSGKYAHLLTTAALFSVSMQLRLVTLLVFEGAILPRPE